MKPIKKLAIAAVFSALCVVVLAIAELFPAARLVVAAAAGLLIAVILIHCGPWWALGGILVSGGLALLLLPDKIGPLWFLAVFGLYAVVKSLIERVNRRWLEWLLKILYFGAIMAVMTFGLSKAFSALLPKLPPLLLYGGLLAAFILYDIACTGLISFYLRRIEPHVG